MWAWATEPHLGGIVPGDLHLVRPVEDALVSVGRAVPEHGLVALVERVAAQLNAILGDRAAEVDRLQPTNPRPIDWD